MQKTRSTILLCLILLLLMLSGCWWQDTVPEEVVKHSETYFVMDTVVDVIVYTAMDEAEMAAIFSQVGDELQRLHDILSAFEPGSDVEKISAAAGQGPVAVHEETLAVVATALEYGDLTQGAFDITLAPLLQLYEFGQDKRRPTEEELAQALPLVGYNLVELDREAGTVFLPREGMGLDLGGVAKGFIVDRAIDLLCQLGVESAVVNAGGDISFTGPKVDGSPWRIGIKDPHNPHDPKAYFAVAELAGKAIVTSGDYERYFEQGGLRYHHIIDPQTGHPARLSHSVTIVTERAEEADLLSTAVFILGPVEGMALVENLEGVEALIWGADDQVIASSGLEWEDRR